MMNTDLIKNISPEEIEKYKMLASIFGNNSTARLEQITLQTLVNESIAFAERNRAPKTCDGLKLVCKHLLRYFSPLRNVETIQLKDAECFLDSLRKNAPLGVYNYRRVLRAMWNKAKDWNYVRENPFEKVKLAKRQVMKPVYVTEQQLVEIVKHIDSEVVKDVVVTAFYSGCRLSEIVNLTWKDVNLKDDLLIIGNKDFATKGRKQRIVPIHLRVREVLLRRLPVKIFEVDNKPTPLIPLPRGDKENKGYVFFKGNGFPFTGDHFSRRFKRACRKAGVEEEIHFHCLRHGTATKMIMNGALLPSVQIILGHANIQTTMIYTHPDLENLREAVNRL